MAASPPQAPGAERTALRRLGLAAAILPRLVRAVSLGRRAFNADRARKPSRDQAVAVQIDPSSAMRARPVLLSSLRRRWAGVSVTITSSVGRTWADLRCTPIAMPPRRPTVT